MISHNSIRVNVFLLLATVLFSCVNMCHAQKMNPKVEAALAKVLMHYKDNNNHISVKYVTYAYSSKEDKHPRVNEDMVLWVNGQKMYYGNKDYEYYQNERASIWWNVSEKVARYVPNADHGIQKTESYSMEDMINMQLETILLMSDSMVYSGLSDDHKEMYSMYVGYGEYNRVDFYFNKDYSMDRTVYYYNDNDYVYKSEIRLSPLTTTEIDVLENKIKPIALAINSNNIASYFKNYQFLEIE